MRQHKITMSITVLTDDDTSSDRVADHLDDYIYNADGLTNWHGIAAVLATELLGAKEVEQ